jgi:hypothetical protein
MKKASQILKDRPRINVVITRDSVCAADDCHAPHERSVYVYSFTDPEVFARETSMGYLPNVAGAGHSWSCHLNGKKIAEIKPDSIHSMVCDLEYQETNLIHFVYNSAVC